MRQTFDPQPPLGAIPIENLIFNPRSRDDTEVLCYALQALWCDVETRDEVLALIQKSHSETVNGANGKNIIPAGDGLLAGRVKFGCLP